jgi:O-antigen ligase
MLVIFQQFHRGPLGIPLETLNSISSVGIYADENPNLYRPSGIFGSPNIIATLITLSLLISLPLMQSKKTIHRPLIISSLVVGLFALIATASRASWIIAVVVAMAMYYLKDVPSLTLESIKRSFVKTGLVVVVIGIIAFGWILPRLASLEKVFENHGGAQYRLRHIDIAKDFVLTYPFGVGANIFQFQIVKQYPADYIFADSTPAHNALAEIGSDFGFIGLILFPAMYYIIIKDAYRLKKVSVFNTCIFWALTSYLLSIQFHPWLFEKPIAELFWILSGVIRHEKSSYIETNHS